MITRITILLCCTFFSSSLVCQTVADRKMIIITFDGYRWEDVFKGADSAMLVVSLKGKKDSVKTFNKYWSSNEAERREKLMPFLWRSVATKGQLYGNRNAGSKVNVTNKFWFSYPGYNEIFTGYADSLINSNDYTANPNVTVLEFINQQEKYKKSVASFASWAAFTRILNKERSGFPVNAGFTDFEGKSLTENQKLLNTSQHLLPKVFGPNERHDAMTYYLAKEYLKQNHPRVLYISFIETDAYAHRNLYDMYLASGKNNDAMIEDLWTYIQADPFYKDQTTLFIATDHGRGDNQGMNWTHHNNKTPGSDEVWFAVMGPYTPPLGEIKNEQTYQNQYAATMAALLGMNFISPHPAGAVIKKVINTK